ncbi:MAG: hypothetical protein ACLP2F_05340 [Steroidobacteraceae bacterium]
MLDIAPNVTAKARAGKQLREASGFSDENPVLKKRKNAYRNPDGAFSHKAR